MNVLDMTISRVSRISMALSLMLLASWVWFNFLTQPEATNLFVSSQGFENRSMFQKISLGNLRLPGTNELQAREGGASIADLPLLPNSQMGSQMQVRQLDGVEVVGNTPLGNTPLGNSGLANSSGALSIGSGQAGVTNFQNAQIQGGPAPLLPSAQRQNIQIADLPFLVNAPPVEEILEDEQIVIAAPSARLTVNPFAPIYVEEEESPRRSPVVNSVPNNNASTNQASNQRSTNQARAAVVEEPVKPKIEVGTVPTPRPLLPPPTIQSNLPASMTTASIAAKPSLLRAPIRSSYYNPEDVPEPVVIEIPAEVVEAPVVVEAAPEPLKLDRSRLTGIRLPVNGAGSTPQSTSQVNSRSYTGNKNISANALPSVTEAPASPKIASSTIAARLPQTAGVRPALTVPALQPIGLAQAQLIGRRNVPVVEAPPVEEVVEEVVEAPVPQLRPVQIALRVPEPVAPVAPVPVVQAPVIPEVVTEEPVVEEVIVEAPIVEEPVVEEVDVVEIPTSQPYVATVSNTLDVAQAVQDTTTLQATAAPSASEGTEATDVAGASVVAKYVRDNNISFTGAILGPVSVAIFESRMGSFHVPIGETIPDTDIRLTNVKRHEVEVRQGSESHIIYLDLGQ